jgi:trehalose-phosphatase
MGVSASFHSWRAPDECEARAALEALAERARARGLVTRFGRKVLEVLPPVDANKGTAVRFLLAERGLTRALFAGDDTTDLDAFAAVRSVELGVCVAVASAEGPAELRERADLVVATPAEFREQVLQQL